MFLLPRLRNLYLQQSRITDPGQFEYLFPALSRTSVEHLIGELDGLLMHANTAEYLGIRGEDRRGEVELHTVPQILARLFEIPPSIVSLTNARPYNNRVFVTCAQFAILLTSALRYQGIPARVRYGFPPYHVSPIRPQMPDHAIVEYWVEERERWAKADSELVGYYERPIARRNKIDRVFDLPDDMFQNPAQILWDILLGRITKADELYGYGNVRGLRIVIPTLLHDAASLLCIEPLPWSQWGLLLDINYEDISPYADLLTKVANAVLGYDQDPAELARLFATNESLKIPVQFQGTRESVYTGAS